MVFFNLYENFRVSRGRVEAELGESAGEKCVPIQEGKRGWQLGNFEGDEVAWVDRFFRDICQGLFEIYHPCQGRLDLMPLLEESRNVFFERWQKTRTAK